MNFGEKLKRICKEEKINLREFSELIEIPYNSVRQYSSGRRTPTWDQIYKIANTPRFEKYQQFILSPDSDKIETDTNELSYNPETKQLMNAINEKMAEYNLSPQDLLSEIDFIFKDLDEKIHFVEIKRGDNDNDG